MCIGFQARLIHVPITAIRQFVTSEQKNSAQSIVIRGRKDARSIVVTRSSQSAFVATP